MKFCLVTTFFPPQHFGGDAVFVAHLANALVADGHQVHVIHCADSFELLRNGVQPSAFPLDPRVTVHTLRSRWGPASPLLTQMTGRPFLKRAQLSDILSQGFDVIHWHNLSLVGGPGALALGRGIQLCTLHDYWWICPTSILFKNNREACVKPSCIRCTLAHRRPPQLWRSGGLLSKEIGQVHRFLAPSGFVREKYEQSGAGISPTVLPHFVPRAEVIDAAREDFYLVVTRLERAKGLQNVVPLFGKTGRRLVIAGAGNYEAELRAQAAPYGNIQFLGRVDHAELGALYAKARATLVPSICYETFGLTVLESLQQKTPVIVSNYGAPKEIIAETGGGAVYESLSELESILRRWDDDPEVARSLGHQGFAKLGKYAPETHIAKYRAIVEEELSASHG
jgi:glycosyltransferase involved in cell wall biosynthesis